MSLEDRFVCKKCEKIILYERPLFCPYCGAQVDPTEGLDLQTGEVEVYRWSGIAPTLIWILSIYLLLSIPVLFLLGRTGFVFLSIAFALSVVILALTSVFVHWKKK